MKPDEAIINPVKGKNAPNIGPVVVMASSQSDLDLLCETAKIDTEYSKSLMMSKVYVAYNSAACFSAAGPVVGAPYAVMMMETLIAWGAKKIIFSGWCGSISPDVRIGDMIVPNAAFIDEGTSKHYHADQNETASPSAPLTEMTKDILRKKELVFHEGAVWSTDAIYRETVEKILYFQKKNALAVEMELSALFTVGKVRDVEVCGILTVSDELATLTWQPGFKNEKFRQARTHAAEVITELCQRIQNSP
jgi:purine-nucleoside phosphorylase